MQQVHWNKWINEVMNKFNQKIRTGFCLRRRRLNSEYKIYPSNQILVKDMRVQ